MRSLFLSMISIISDIGINLSSEGEAFLVHRHILNKTHLDVSSRVSLAKLFKFIVINPLHGNYIDLRIFKSQPNDFFNPFQDVLASRLL